MYTMNYACLLKKLTKNKLKTTSSTLSKKYIYTSTYFLVCFLDFFFLLCLFDKKIMFAEVWCGALLVCGYPYCLCFLNLYI